MHHIRSILVLLTFFLCGVAHAELSSSEQRLNDIIAEHWDFVLRENPTAATSVGVNDFNDRMPVVTREAQLRRMEAEKRLLRRSADIDRSALSEGGRINADIFAWVLEDSIAEYELNLSRIPFNTFSGFFMNALTASDSVAMNSVADYEAYIARMADIPRYFDENLDNMREGASNGFVLPQIVIDGVLPTVEAQLKSDPEDSSFYGPFVSMSDRVSAEDQERLRSEGRNVIATQVLPAFAEVASYLGDEYSASASVGAEQLAEGKAYYAFNIKRYTTLTDATADEIHRTGLAEVARIRKDMDKIIAELEFDGDFAAFGEFLRTDPQFYADSKEQLLKETAYIAKRIDYKMPGFFGKLPRQPYGIVPVPDEIAPNYTTGAYYGAPLGGRNGGAFWVNTYALDQRPLYEIPALTLHEAVPGHHHQSAISAELEDVPEFRRNLYFSAYGEGWALYTEKLGVEMDVYQTPYEHFGRLSYEMWRACRLVVDTGLHSQGWTRQQALDFFMQNTSLSEGNIRAEVDRYISWPGQALAYKLGELKIWELRRIAEHDLGDDFDLREFHDVVLGNGALPLAMLEAVVLQWVEEKAGDRG
ncbi:MAG: DUF885 domain-containing protein [Gammaproteobacteria bacterium]|nr:DUF885 domain-containing protein [Gammaproteobacteria bacterium]